MSSGTVIEYGNITAGAKENFVPSADEFVFSDITQLQRYNKKYPNYGNPCELYLVALDGKSLPAPENYANKNIGFVSEVISDEYGVFSQPVILTFVSEEKYKSQGITITFDVDNNIYSDEFNIKWYNGENVVKEENVLNDNSIYVGKYDIDEHDKIVITFASLNMPYNRLRVRGVDHGYGTIFDSKDIKDVQIYQEIDPISAELPISTAEIVINAEIGDTYNLQEKQPITIYSDDEIQASVFIKKIVRLTDNEWKLMCEDWISVLDYTPFVGGAYSSDDTLNGKTYNQIFEEICKTAKVPYTINNISDEYASGSLENVTTCREALQQLAFGSNLTVTTSESVGVSLIELPKETKRIPKERIMQGTESLYNDEGQITKVTITPRSYSVSYSNQQLLGYNTQVPEVKVFDVETPYSYGHEITTTRADVLEIEIFPTRIRAVVQFQGSASRLSSFFVYATAQTSTTETLEPKSYEVPLLSGYQKANDATVSEATFVTLDNIDEIGEKVIKYLSNPTELKVNIVEGKHDKGGILTKDEPIKLGDMLEVDTELGVFTGRAVSQKYNLNGNIKVKEVIIQ